MTPDPAHADALKHLSSYWSEMKSWEDRAAIVWAKKDDPERDTKKEQFARELDQIHESYCIRSEWTEYLVVCTPSYFEFDILEIVQKTRNHLVVHVAHRNQAIYPYRFQFEVRCLKGSWKVASMWQTLPSGKRIRCPF